MPGGRPEDQVPVGDLGSGKEVTPLQRVGYKLALLCSGIHFRRLNRHFHCFLLAGAASSRSNATLDFWRR